jgi:hypothetical protein
MFVFVQTGQAQQSVRNYFSDTSSKVKATEDASQKREILSSSLQTMSDAMGRFVDSPLLSADDRAGIARLKASVNENQFELAGLNGFEAVPDANLNAFSDYVVQSMEQADHTITISLVAALLIVIILILIV